MASLRGDAKRMLSHVTWLLGTKSLRNLTSSRLNELYTTYIKELRACDREQALYPDGNHPLPAASGTIPRHEYDDGQAPQHTATPDAHATKANPAESAIDNTAPPRPVPPAPH